MLTDKFCYSLSQTSNMNYKEGTFLSVQSHTNGIGDPVGGLGSYLRYLRIVVSNTYYIVFLFCFSSSCVHYVASFAGLSILRYSLTFIIHTILYW